MKLLHERFARTEAGKTRGALSRLRRKEDGAEAVEFALIAPIAFFLVIGLLYVLLLFAAQLSLAHATAVGVRYAAIMDSATLTYPTTAQVKTKIADTTPLFGANACTPVFTNSSTAPNSLLRLDVTCSFPNPAGSAISGLRNAFFGGGSTVPSTVSISAAARARKE